MTRIIIAATPIYGHVAPLRSIAADLVARGHHVTFLSGSVFAPFIEGTGARFVPFTGNADFNASDPAAFPGRADLEAGPAQIDFDIRRMFTDPMAVQHRALQALLGEAGTEKPGEPVVVLHDTVFLGMWPVLLGAPGIRPKGVIGIGVTPLPLTSIDTAPFGLGLPPDSSEAGRTRNLALNSMIKNELFASAQSHLAQVLQSTGAMAPPPFVFDGLVTLPDRFLQLTIAALEYERSDAPAGLRYAGALLGAASRFSLPPWWAAVAAASKVVLVTQGTIANRDFDELIKPTLSALADMDGLVVVAVTGRAGADIGPIPANAYVADFIPFDQLLPHVDVLVSNGGYGGIQQALSHGVPLVLAGESEDKIEVTARVAHTGAAINLRTSRPDAAALRDAVHAALDDPAYQRNAQRLQKEYARQDAFALIASNIFELASANAPESAS
ncbi:MAG: glycosyltransferase, family [Polaromonas sp.]|nr:glycosyltransferase, family [Polaromonas sp.]